MLYIAFAELAARAQEQLGARKPGFGVHQCHRVLQLVAEAEGAARLVIAAARPQAARQGLVQKPAVSQHVERLVGCLHLDRAQGVVPVMPDRFERPPRGVGAAETMHHPVGIIAARRACQAEPEDDLALLPVSQIESHLDRCARIQTAAQLAGQMGARHRRRILQAAVAADEFGAIAGGGPVQVVHVEEGDPIGKLGVIRVARVERAAVRIDFGAHVHGRFRPQVAQHPFHVARGGQPARPAGGVAHLEHARI